MVKRVKFFTDLHIHSRFSGGTSKNMTLKNIDYYARLKGLGIMGTGDITHPGWMNEIKNYLEPTDPGDTGLYIVRRRASSTEVPVYFMLTGEVSANFTDQQGRSRRIHNLLLVPNLAIADQLNEQLSLHSDLTVDGRPELTISNLELLDIIRSVDSKIENIVAHIWTSHFSALGARGFDSLSECYGGKVDRLLALETGLSSDPPMNWRVKELDPFPLVSNSDCHSPYPNRIGREANLLELSENPSFQEIVEVIRSGTKPGKFLMTIETNPSYGKYHFTGHRSERLYRKHGEWVPHEIPVILTPEEAMRRNNICPVCKGKLTIGVLQRVEELADPDRPPGFLPPNPVPFVHLIPLTEIIAATLGHSSPFTKGVWDQYLALIRKFGDEYTIMLDASKEELVNSAGKELASVIMRVRKGTIKVQPGYDNVYGYPVLEKDEKTSHRDTTPRIVGPVEDTKDKEEQHKLSDFL